MLARLKERASERFGSFRSSEHMEEPSCLPSPRAGMNRAAARAVRGPGDDGVRSPVKAGAMLTLGMLAEFFAWIVEHWVIAAAIVAFLIAADIAGLRP